MNKPTHNLTAEGRALVHAIINIALTTPSNVADVFIDWSPHCCLFHFYVNPGGWTEGAKNVCNHRFYFDHTQDAEKITAALEKAKAALEDCLAKCANTSEADRRAKRAADLRERAAALTAEAAKLEDAR
jgi:hypothetical protein